MANVILLNQMFVMLFCTHRNQKTLMLRNFMYKQRINGQNDKTPERINGQDDFSKSIIVIVYKKPPEFCTAFMQDLVKTQNRTH